MRDCEEPSYPPGVHVFFLEEEDELISASFSGLSIVVDLGKKREGFPSSSSPNKSETHRN